jgi:hypothetical protein
VMARVVMARVVMARVVMVRVVMVRVVMVCVVMVRVVMVHVVMVRVVMVRVVVVRVVVRVWWCVWWCACGGARVVRVVVHVWWGQGQEKEEQTFGKSKRRHLHPSFILSSFIRSRTSFLSQCSRVDFLMLSPSTAFPAISWLFLGFSRLSRLRPGSKPDAQIFIDFFFHAYVFFSNFLI